MKSPTKSPIRKTHPTLYRLIFLLAIVNIVISVFLAFGEPASLINFKKIPDEGIFPPLWFYSIPWTIASVWLLHGLSGNGNYKWTRRGLTLSAMVGGFWAFGFVASFLTGRILGISAPLLWSMYAALCVIVTNEPVINPLAAAIQTSFNSEPVTTPHSVIKRSKKIRDHG